jgi:hypothetical protein
MGLDLFNSTFKEEAKIPIIESLEAVRDRRRV